MEAMCLRVRRACEQSKCHYVLADSSVPLAEIISSYLVARQSNGVVGVSGGKSS